MTQEERQHLLQDLAARVPYGLMIDFYCNESRRKSNFATNLIGIEVDDAIIRDIENNGARIRVDMFSRDCNIKPYLRPMQTITDKEIEERDQIALFHSGNIASVPSYMDWLNEHHFDYRGLITKGLALVAPEGMYNTKTE